MRKIIDNQRGAFVVIFAVALLVLLGFVALGIDAGRWYLVRAELSKSVDAAALAGARNISNPYLTPTTIAEEFGRENFEAGYVGTPQSGDGSVSFTATMVESDKISVTGNVDATATLARLFGINRIPVAAVGMAQRKEVEIMMILDRSGSMAGSKMTALKNAAISFLSYFEETQDRDKVGLVSFATSVRLNRALDTDFVGPMQNAINAMTATGGTNSAGGLDAADGSGGFTDQTGVPGDRRVQQFAIFFSDGQPTCFSGRFRYRATNYDAVACSTQNCRSWETCNIYHDLGEQGREAWLGIDPLPTGDGSTTQRYLRGYFCDDPYYSTQRYCYTYTTRWYIFDTRPVSGYSPTYTNIPESRFNGSNGYVCTTARDLTFQQAQALKARGIRIYTIGLGSDNEIDRDFLRSLSSGEGFAYFAPTSSQLQTIFNRVAQDIKLRLVY